jgi:hypothetical protein
MARSPEDVAVLVVVVVVDDGSTLKVYDSVDEFVPSVAPMVNVDDPAAVGVPVMVAVVLLMPVLRLSPDGNVPEATFHANDVLADVEAVSVCEYELLTVASGSDAGTI